MQAAKFAHPNPSFYVELKKRINDYFKTTGQPMTGGSRILSKAIFLVILLVVLYTTIIFFTPSSNFISILLCMLLGAVASAVGFNVMHDGNHGSFSNSPIVNRLAANTAEFVGASQYMWNMKHNVIHHAYTNIDGIDDDIDAEPFLRMAPTQKKYKMHKFQHYYFWFFYAILHFFWTFISDFKKYFTGKIGATPIKKMKLRDHIEFWVFKAIYYGLFIVIPVVRFGWLPWFIGFAAFTMTAGLILSIVFQLAHTVSDTAFPMPQAPAYTLEDEWAVHQLRTTANFATQNKFICWYVGGLNFQVEHHLFPRISHIHYPAINKIVKQACKDYDVTYIEYDKMYQAIGSHIGFLKQMAHEDQKAA
ncbi:fatty acid desaturase family protein [Rhizosphaericola mali]|uniref:Acyl-CoA desaturase n=1 Tax=Rhizosphaericola mali TaxID=2545455 RepID=A0A5P2G5M8_9BACT|nr:acyl-CoA desaturase [Rhizosphaericola mali]QES89469.1 acyl-CoA desaturase [Rhizosphaericola mali]